MLSRLIAGYLFRICFDCIVHLLESELAPIPTRYRLVFGRIILVRASRQDAALFVEVEAEEERHRVPVHGRLVVDSVDGGFEPVV